MSDGFLKRWSRRKQDVQEGREVPSEPAPPLAPQAATPEPPGAASEPAEAPQAPPTLAEAQALTPASDFSRFAARSVPPEVRNAAMKHLFRDPHFNVMDGLDIYIDDYTRPDPMPLGMLRKLASAQFLGWAQPDDEGAGDASAPLRPGFGGEELKDPSPPDVSQSRDEPSRGEPAPEPAAISPATASPTPHAHSHLRLQPDDASPDGKSGGGPR